MARWLIFAAKPVGYVDARDRETAEQLAAERYGAEHDIVRVQSAASAKIGDDEEAAARRRGKG